MEPDHGDDGNDSGHEETLPGQEQQHGSKMNWRKKFGFPSKPKHPPPSSDEATLTGDRRNPESKTRSALFAEGTEGDCNLDARISEKKANRIAPFIASKGPRIARELKVSDDDINLIKKNHKDDAREEAYQLLRMWMSQYPEKATYRNLIKAVKRLKENEIANKIHSIATEVDSDVEEESPEQETKCDDIFMHEEENTLYIKVRIPENLPRGDKEKYVFDKVRRFLNPDLPVQCEEGELCANSFKSPQEADDVDGDSVQMESKFDMELGNIQHDMENFEEILKKERTIEHLQDATREAHSLINRLLESVTFSEGKVENIAKLREECDRIEKMEINLGQILEDYSKIDNLYKAESNSLKTMNGQSECRKEQRENMEKLLDCMLVNFGRYPASERHSVFVDDSDRDRFRSRRLKTDVKARQRLPSFNPKKE